MHRNDAIQREDDLAPLLEAWDELAQRCRLPYAAPAWSLSWWRHLAPPGARLHVVALPAGSELRGLAAAYVAPERGGSRHARLLGALAGGTPLGPLAHPGAEPEVARRLARSLSGLPHPPHALHLDGVVTASSWPGRIADAWPGLLFAQRDAHRPTHTIRTAGRPFDEWFATKSRNFRQEMARKRRQLDDLGAVIRMSAASELDHDLAAFLRLHASRWEWRGGSGRVRPATEAFLRDVAAELLPRGRFRLWSMEVDGEPISSHLFVSAGGHADYWLGGFDGAWARYSPAMITLLEGIRHAFGEGDTEIGLGSGRQAYKARFAADLDEFEWHTLVPVRAFTSARVWTGVVPRLLARGASDRMPPAVKARLKSAAGRGDTSDV